MESPYYKKYLKYHAKYLQLKNKLSQLGGEQIGGTRCMFCDKEHSGKCKYQLDESQIDDIYIMDLECIISNCKNELYFNKLKTEKKEDFLKIICNLETSIRMHYMRRNQNLWSYFLHFSPYIIDKIEYFNTFTAFHAEQRNTIIPIGQPGIKSFYKFFYIAMKNFLYKVKLPTVLPNEELQRMFAYFQKRVVNMNALFSLRKEDLTYMQLLEFNDFMNQFNLYNIKSKQLDAYKKHDLNIPDITLMIIKDFTPDQKRIIRNILGNFPYIDVYLAYDLILNNATEVEIKILNIILEISNGDASELYKEYKDGTGTKWTQQNLEDIYKIHRFFKLNNNQIKQLEEQLKGKSEDYILNDDTLYPLYLQKKEKQKRTNEDIPAIIISILFSSSEFNYGLLRPDVLAFKEQILRKPSFTQLPI